MFAETQIPRHLVFAAYQKKKTFCWVQPVGAGERIFESICFSGVLMQKGDIQELGNDMLDPSTTMGHCIEAFYKH